MSPPKLESIGFGWLCADGQRYEDDHLITVDGRIVPRPKHLSKKYGGWHTVLGPEEIESALVGDPEIVLVACGHFGRLPIHAAARALIAARGATLETGLAKDVPARYAELVHAGKRVAVVLHVTC